MSVSRVDSNLISLPPAWMSRVGAGGRPLGTQPEVRKLLGEPVPKLADLAGLPAKIAQYFRPGGLLERIRRKLASISRKQGGKMLAAHNTVAAVDGDDNVYVGVEFLGACEGDEGVIAGILAHEWGHMVSELPRDVDWSHLSWEELFAVRRDEEAGADAYAGRALYQLDYPVDPLVAFLLQLEQSRTATKQVKTLKYYDATTRAAILRGAYDAERRTEENARKLLTRPGYRHPSFSKLLAIG